ncbi:uncharacterized protein KY384_008156 [Bacidia gigantensis]|uniref:uncharacterized protein n=1 Tax=Bacidia gigantensis TaxID=2732470 RepID=UPI001D040703|nr:uncharacterized protein KY384_008156 [Bacidia gigantensis]KAG8526727.1 hypothetical protein KY384_008156 [Bacidia gigantensis]
MTDKDSSTLKGYADEASGKIQSTLGNLTGNNDRQAEGDIRKGQAESEQEASHTIGKIGGYNVSSSGGMSQDDPRRQQGSWDQTVGSGKEAMGNALGVESLKKEGREQNARGQGTEAEGQLSDFGSGIKDRVQGTFGGAAAGLTGDREAQTRYQNQHDDGKTAQRSAEQDIQRQNQ